MIPRRARQIRTGLAVLALAVVGWVAFTFRPAPHIPDGVSAAEPGDPLPRPGAQRTRDVVITKVKNGREVRLEAREMVGREDQEVRLRGVSLHFPYRMKGKDSVAEVTSDECLYTPAADKAEFTGNVHLSSPDGFGLETEFLAYDGPRENAYTDKPFTFHRNHTSGQGTGFKYKAADSALTILADVVVRIADERGATEIRSQTATLENVQHTARFVGDVRMTHGNDALDTEELLVNFNHEREAIERMQALKSFHARLAGASSALGGVDQSGGAGLRELSGGKLDFWFRPDQTLDHMAQYNGDLVIHPGPKDPPEKRTLKGEVLSYVFDEQSRLKVVDAQRDVSLVIESTGETPAPPRSVSCRRLIANFNPQSGELETGVFQGEVVFVSGSRKATSGSARFGREQHPGGVLMMTKNPEIVDLEEGSRLKAQSIWVAVDTGDLRALKNVQHQVGAKPGRKSLNGRESDALLTCEAFSYDASRRQASYKKNAVLRSGRDELHAADIQVVELPSGRRLHARGDVLSIVSTGKKEAEAVPMEIRARDMVYDEAARRIDYTGDVVMRQAGTTSRSPKSIVYLNAAGNDLDRIEAGEPIVVEQGKRVANGTWGIYNPEGRTLSLTGTTVTLHDNDGQSVRGKSLTFNMTEDSIHIDGQEESRTETVIKRGEAMK